MYRRILVPLDGSKLAKRVLPYVRLLAKAVGTRITLFKVVEPLPPHVGTELNPVRNIHRTHAFRMEKARRYLMALTRSMKANGLEVEHIVRDGNPGREIIEEAMLEPGTLIAMSSHGRQGLPRLWYGSVTDEILHKTEIPMFIVGPNAVWNAKTKMRLGRLIVALDGSAFAEKVLPHAAAVAEALGAKITLAKVTPAEGLHYYENGADGGDEEKPVSETIDARAERYLSTIEERIELSQVGRVDKHVLHGQVTSAALLRYADEANGSVIALASHARTGLARSLIGSLADALIQESRHPLLVLHVAHHHAGYNPATSVASDLASVNQ